MVRAGDLYKDLLVTVLYLFFGMYLSHNDVVQRLRILQLTDLVLNSMDFQSKYGLLFFLERTLTKDTPEVKARVIDGNLPFWLPAIRFFSNVISFLSTSNISHCRSCLLTSV